MIKRNKRFSNPEDEPKSLVSQAVKGGKYRKKDPPSSRIAGKIESQTYTPNQVPQTSFSPLGVFSGANKRKKVLCSLIDVTVLFDKWRYSLNTLILQVLPSSWV